MFPFCMEVECLHHQNVWFCHFYDDAGGGVACPRVRCFLGFHSEVRRKSGINLITRNTYLSKLAFQRQMVRFNGSLNPHFGRKISALWRRDAAPCAEARMSRSTDPLTILEPSYPHFQLLEVKMLYYVLHGMTTGAKFPRSELVAFVKNRAIETALTSPTGRLTSSRFKLSVHLC